MSSRGYFQLPRDQFAGDDLLWDDGTPFDSRSAWIWLCQSAAWKDGEYRSGNRVDSLKRGEFVASIRYLARRWQWDKNRVSRFLKKMTDAGRITRQRTGQHGIVYLIVNYDVSGSWHPSYGTHTGTDGETIVGHARGSRRDSSADKVEEYKKIKNISVTSGDVTAPYSPEFEQLWAVYPKRSGSNSKRAAYRQYVARLKQGVSPTEMYDGVVRYAAYVEARGLAGTELVKMASTFLGRDEHFRDRYELPPPSATSTPAPTHVERARQLFALYKEHGFSRVQSVDAYKATVQHLANTGVIREPRRFWAELLHVKPWTWLSSIRATDTTAAVRRIAEAIAQVPPVVEKSEAAA